MSLEVGTGKAKEANSLLTAFQRGRYDYQYFAQTFLGETLHDGQLKWITEAQATVNVLASSNRYGKTFLTPCGHFHACIYKTGAEHRYMRPNPAPGEEPVDIEKFIALKYNTIHTADGWETAALVWDEAHKLYRSQQALAAFVPQGGAPRSQPPHFDFINGSRWKFRTLGHDASGIDGDSFYLISIDEAGWVSQLKEKMRNVIRVRVADVRGRIWLIGTFKPGISKDFFEFAVRASTQTGAAIGFDHRDDVDDQGVSGGLASSIRKYLRDFGIDLDEYADALGGNY